MVGVYPRIREYWSSINSVSPEEMLGGSSKDVTLICPDCNHATVRIPSTLVKTKSFKCKNAACKKTHKLADVAPVCDCLQKGLATPTKGTGYICEHVNLLAMCPDIALFWSSKNDKQPSKVSKCSTIIVLLQCPKCKYEDKKSAATLTSAGKYECPQCFLESNSLLKACPGIDRYWSPENALQPNQISYGSNATVHLLCPDCNYTESKFAYSITEIGGRNGKYPCPGCYLLENNVARTHRHLLLEVNDGTDLTTVTRGHPKKIEWKCQKCSYIWSAMLSNRARPEVTNHGRKATGCKRCAHLIPITYEVFLKRVKACYQGKYTYQPVCENFKLAESIIEGICPDHGSFKKLAIFHTKAGCRHCVLPKSKLCIELERWLNLIGIPFTVEKKFKQLKYVSYLSYDYLIVGLDGRMYMIECDDQQHFKLSRWDKSNDNVLLRIKRDIIKDQFCVDNGISLIRIPYTMTRGIFFILQGFLAKHAGLGHFICTYGHYAERLKVPDTCKLMIVRSPTIQADLANLNVLYPDLDAACNEDEDDAEVSDEDSDDE